MSNDGHGGVTYTVKEMLEQLDKKIDRIDAKLDSKVDVSAFAQVQQRVEAAADRAIVLALEVKVNELIGRVEIQDRVNAALASKAKELQQKTALNFTRKEKVLGALIALAALGVQVYVTVAGVIG